MNRAGNALRGLGVRMEERVLLVLLDTVRFPAVFFGAIKIGAVPVPVNTLLTAKDYDDLLRDTRARVLVVSAPLFDRIATILPGQPYLEHVIIDGAAPGGSDARALDATLAAASPELEAARTCAADFAFWLYTSGSTGQLKGAVRSFEVEAALVARPDVLDAAVVGHADENGLIKPRAIVVLAAGAVASDALTEALKLHVKATLAPYKYPRWVEIVAELPKTATGKIQRFKLRKP